MLDAAAAAVRKGFSFLPTFPLHAFRLEYCNISSLSPLASTGENLRKRSKNRARLTQDCLGGGKTSPRLLLTDSGQTGLSTSYATAVTTNPPLSAAC